MPRGLSSIIALMVLGLPAFARAEAPVGGLRTTTAADEIGDQAIGADVGLATGGRVTPGGLRIAGHYLYQLSSTDWFDGTASFTFGGDAAGCFRDRMNTLACEHGYTSGSGVEISANVRRVFAAQGAFRPFARAGVGVALVRFGRDDVAGIAFPLHVGGGLRAQVAPSLAIVTQADLQVGFGGFSRGLGAEPQLGFALTAGAEFRLR